MNISTAHVQEPMVYSMSEGIIRLIRDTRNTVIEKLLDDTFLRTYLEENHQLSAISAVKLEFIQRALKELYATPVDLVHYSQLILKIRKMDSMVISINTELVFYQDIERAIVNYL